MTKFYLRDKPPCCLHVLGQPLVDVLHEECRTLYKALKRLHSDSTTFDFNEHWESYKQAEQLLNPTNANNTTTT